MFVLVLVFVVLILVVLVVLIVLILVVVFALILTLTVILTLTLTLLIVVISQLINGSEEVLSGNSTIFVRMESWYAFVHIFFRAFFALLITWTSQICGEVFAVNVTRWLLIIIVPVFLIGLSFVIRTKHFAFN